MLDGQSLDIYPSDEEIVSSGNGTGVEVEDIGGDEEFKEPFDPSLIRVETRQMTLDLLLTRIREMEIDLLTDFQRKAGIWKDPVQSRLIESMLIRIPLPAFYFDATNDDKWLVVDGLQRLHTLTRFVIKQELRLKGMEFLTDLNGRAFGELSRNYQRRIVETPIIAYLIQEGTPANAKFNVFKRINTEGLPLSSQEIRHALNQGKVTKFLGELASSDAFKTATCNSIRDDRMADRECVLRFLAFTITPYDTYGQRKIADLDSFLNEKMSEMNKMSQDELDLLKQRFEQSMYLAHTVFGHHAFRKVYSVNGPRYPINKALFETWSVTLGKLSHEESSLLVDRQGVLLDKFVLLLKEQFGFLDSVSQGTGDPRKVMLRFRSVSNLVAEVLQQ